MNTAAIVQPAPARSDDEIEARVINVVARVLDREPETIRPESSLESDLGAESLDYLDMAFSLEREFNVHFPRVDVLQRAVAHFGEDKLWLGGKLTGFGVELLRRSMPEVPPERLSTDMPIAELRRLFSVATFIRVVRQLLDARAQLPAACPECGGKLVEAKVTPQLVCESCQHSIGIPSGDDVMAAELIAIGNSI